MENDVRFHEEQPCRVGMLIRCSWPHALFSAAAGKILRYGGWQVDGPFARDAWRNRVSSAFRPSDDEQPDRF